MSAKGLARRAVTAVLGAILLCPVPGQSAKAKKKTTASQDSLAAYISRVKGTAGGAPTVGSLWTPESSYTDLSSDYKARKVNDLIIIQIVEQTTASVNGTVKSARTFAANSSVGVMGTPGATSGWQNIFSPSSSRALNGQTQTSSDSSLTTSLSGRVVEVLPNGAMVVEAQRDVDVNNQHQTVILRGVVRPGDVTSGNYVPSTAVSNLEVELKGHGVVSDGVAPPNRLVRGILKIVGF